MINSLTINNFQSHKKSYLEFAPGSNFIIGSSDTGKTAILRVLGWIINNKPSGESFRSHWGGSTFGKVIIDKKKIVRFKGKKGNFYKLDDKKFVSFGQDIPEEIKQLLNFSSLNLQKQFDSPFLLALSGGEVAKYLNKIVHLNKIDSSIFNINRILRKEKADLEYTKIELEETKKKDKQFDWIESTEGCLVKLELFEKALHDKKKKYGLLSSIIAQLDTFQKELNQYIDITKYDEEINLLIKKEDEIKDSLYKKNDLKNKIESIQTIEESIKRYDKEIIEDLNTFNKDMPSICPLCGKKNK